MTEFTAAQLLDLAQTGFWVAFVVACLFSVVLGMAFVRAVW